MRKQRLTITRIGLVALTLSALAIAPAIADYDAGLSYFKQGKYVESAAEWEAVVANAPEYAFGYFMLGNCYLKLKKYRDAEPNFRKAIELDPTKYDYHANLAKTIMTLKKYDEVIVVLDQAESLASKNKQKLHLHKLRGLALLQVKDYDRAVQDLKLAHPAQDHQVAAGLARACQGTRDYACLKKATTQAMALKANDERTLGRFVSYAIDTALRTPNKAKKLSFYRDAEPQAAKLLKIAKDKVKAHKLYGAALLGTKKYSQAIAEFRTVLKVEPKNCNAMINIATAQTELEEWNEVLNWAKKAASCNPNSAMALGQQALAYNKLHDWENAIAVAEKATRLKSTTYLADLLQTAREGKKARDHNKAVEADAERVKREQEEAARLAREEAEKRKAYESATGTGGGGND